jgi:hypothetical protein
MWGGGCGGGPTITIVWGLLRTTVLRSLIVGAPVVKRPGIKNMRPGLNVSHNPTHP